MLLILASARTTSLIVPFAMIGMAIFSMFWRRTQTEKSERNISRSHKHVGYVLTFTLGIYGGFFSGGYVTLLRAVFVIAFGCSLREAIAMTKILIGHPINVWAQLPDAVLSNVPGPASGRIYGRCRVSRYRPRSLYV